MSRSKIAIVLLVLTVIVMISLSQVDLGTVSAARQASPQALTAGPQIAVEIGSRNLAIDSGGTARFEMKITNVGSLALQTITVSGSPVASCNQTGLGPLGVGESINFSCEEVGLTQNLLNEVVVTGVTADEVETVRRTGWYAKLTNDVLSIEKRDSTPPIDTQTVVKGSTARFTIILRNFSSDITLTQVTVDDSVANNCDLNPAFPLNLGPGETEDYICSLPNVQAPVTTIATAQGINPVNGDIYTDSVAYWVDVLGLTATLIAEPGSLPEPGGLISYSVQLTNPGSFPVVLSALSTDKFGNILDPNNSLVAAANNTCLPAPDLPTIQPYGGSYSCSFKAEVTGQPPEFAVVLTAKALSLDQKEVTATATSAVTLTNVPAEIALTVSAEPPFINPPGQVVTFTVRIDNESEADTVTITQLKDSVLGGLNNKGSCKMPQTFAPGEAYQCEYTDNVQGEAGEEKTRRITASGVDDDTVPGAVSANKLVTVLISDQVRQFVYFPTTTKDVVGSLCKDAYPLRLNRQYFFLPPLPYNQGQNPGSFFSFTLTQTGSARIELTNFVPRDGQLVVWSNTNCTGLVKNDNTALNKVLELGTLASGTYIVQLINDGPRNEVDLYGLVVRNN